MPMEQLALRWSCSASRCVRWKSCFCRASACSKTPHWCSINACIKDAFGHIQHVPLWRFSFSMSSNFWRSTAGSLSSPNMAKSWSKSKKKIFSGKSGEIQHREITIYKILAISLNYKIYYHCPTDIYETWLHVDKEMASAPGKEILKRWMSAHKTQEVITDDSHARNLQHLSIIVNMLLKQ